MEIKKIRCLQPNEIEVRVQSVGEKGAQLLLYKDSRCDKRILDETFGILGWKDSYQEIKGNLFCTVSIWDDDKKQWVDKQDCGVESFSEKEKGQASDAFKRACFNVGIGRELYTRIFYYANVATKYDASKKKYELADKYMTFHVVEIKTNEETEKIEKIKIADNKDNIVFEYGYSKPSSKKTTTKTDKEEPKQEEVAMIDAKQTKALHAIFGKNEKLKESVYNQLKIKSSKELTYPQAEALIKQLNEKINANKQA